MAGITQTGHHEEYNDDMQFPLLDLVLHSSCSLHDATFSYCKVNIHKITSELGIPWEVSKDIQFSSEIPFTSHLWNLNTQTVSIPTKKAECHKDCIRAWKGACMHTLEDLQKLYSKLLHACLVVPVG